MGIAMNVKKPMTIMGPICRHCNERKKSKIILGPMYEDYIFENGLMEFRIKNDVGIACLECGIVLKSLGDVSLITLDVGIPHCSF
jgi:hypothetical protein